LLLTSTSSTQTEGIGFYLSEDSNGNATINKFTFDENTAGLNGPTAPTITNDGAVESNLIGADLQYFASFSDGSNGSGGLNNTFTGTGASYSLAWAQYNNGTYTVDFQTFSPGGTPVFDMPNQILDASGLASFTQAPAWYFRSAGGDPEHNVIYASAIAQLNADTQSDYIQFQFYSVAGAAVDGSFQIDPNLAAYGPDATDLINQQAPSSAHTSSSNSLVFVPNAGSASGYSLAWDDTVTAGGTTYQQVEFAIYHPRTGTLVSQSEFQIADGNVQNVELAATTIDGANVEILAYGDNTGTHVVEFDASGNEIASLFDPSTTTFGGLGLFGDGRISLTYDNVLDASGTSQYTTDIYDLRTTGLNVNDSTDLFTSDQYFAGTHFNDTVTGANNVNNEYYFVGQDAANGAAPSDTFHGGGSGGWNIAIFADARADYTIATQIENGPNVTTITSDGADPAHTGSLAVTNVEILAFDPAGDPTPVNGTIDVNGGTFVILGGSNAVTIEAGATAEIDAAASGETSYTGNVAFAGATGTLQVDHLNELAGQITGITPGDANQVLDLDGFNAQSGDQFSVAPTLNDSGNTVLTVTDTTSDNHPSESLSLVGDHTGDIWTATNDGHGGADVFDPPAANAATSVLSTATADGASGSVAFADANSGDTFSASFTPEGANYVGNFSVSAVTENNGTASVGFDFGSDQVNLSPGGTVTQSYNVTLADAQNPAANGSQNVAVTIGGPGNDNFVFAPGVGADTITNFNPQQDTIELNHFTDAQTVQELQSLITTDAHGDAVLNLGHNDSITLANVTTPQLQQAILANHVLLH
jgi:hypothetical protein